MIEKESRGRFYRRVIDGAWIRRPEERSRTARLAAALASFAVAFALRAALRPILGPHVPFVLYYLAVISAGAYGGLGPGLLCVGLSLAGAAYSAPRPIGFAEVLSFSLSAAVGLALTLIIESLHRARAAVRSTFEQTGEVLESVSDAFYSVDADWRLTAVNAAAERYWGKSRRDLLGKGLWDAFPEAAGTDGHRAHLEAAERRKPVELETTMQDRQIHFSIHPSGTGLAVFFKDITERKKDEERFRLVVEQSPNAIVIMGRDGRITFVNAQAEKLFLYPREELHGRLIEILVPPRFRAAHPGYRNGFLAAPKPRPMGAGRDLFGLRKDGTEVPVEIGLTPIQSPEGQLVLASIIDITERKKSEERFRLVVEASPNAIVVVGRGGLITFVNSQAEKLFLYPREELIGKAIELLVPDRFRAKHPGYRDGFFASPNARPMGAGRDLYGLRKDGSEVPVEIGLNPFQSHEGSFVLASVIDITQRKKTEQELARAREELARRAENLEETVAERTRHLQQVIVELETFSYTASHDLRAPLRAVQGYSHFLVTRLGDKLDDESRMLLERMSASATRMDRLVQDLLSYTRIGRGEDKMQPIDLDAVVSHIVGQYPGLDKIQLRVKSPLGRALGRDSLVTQALSNLIDNAVKFVPGDRTPSIDIWTGLKEGRVTVFIQDNGIGIAPEYHSKIFSPFIRLDPAGPYEGTGIGLAIAKKAVERMGGRISLESELGKGARFAVELQEAR